MRRRDFRYRENNSEISCYEGSVDAGRPVVHNIMVNDSDGTSPVVGSGGSLNAVLRFNAYADHDQMPIVRMAVDWGDESDTYVMQGWFKNRKWECGQLTSDKGNSCATANESCRIHFGDSSDACEQGFYQFTHIYECPGEVTSQVPACSPSVTANCWDASTQSCKFKPKVQVLDNWGWCNGETTGYWNDKANVEEDKKECSPKKDEPWTKFGGTVEVKP